MSITPSPVPPRQEAPPPSGAAPSYVYAPPAPPRSNLPIVLLAILLVVGLGALGYYAKTVSDRVDQMKASLDSTLASQGETLQRLSQHLDKSDARANEMQGEFTVTKNRLGMTQAELQKAHEIAAQLAEQQKQSTEQLNSQLGQLAKEQTATKESLSSDITGVKGDVQKTNQELAATKSQLQSVVGDLGVQSGLIAHTKSDLDELRARGERDYYEFDLRKTKNGRQKVGTIQLELKNADPKKLKYTVALVVDDKTIEKKDKTVSEPVQFYQQGYRMPSEIVVNQIYKDRIVGYLSTPKKKEDRVPMKAAS